MSSSPFKEGKIFISDYDITQIHYESLRKYIGVIPQNFSLFSENIIENIALGESFPNFQKIIDLSKQFGITEFLEKLPQQI